jgi:hypothetical protein
MRRLALFTMLIALALPAAAQAQPVAPGLSRSDAQAIFDLAGAHWPGSPCRTARFATIPPSAMRGQSVARAAGTRCAIVFNAGRRLSAVGWCRALEPVLRRLAAGARPSAWPYDCSTAVGPIARKPQMLLVPGVSSADVQRAYRVASAHWPSSPCRGREQLRWATPAMLAAGSGGEPGDGAVTLGEARLRDPRCVAYFNSSWTPWTVEMLCHVAEHEFGHLYGLGHSADPNDVMAPTGGHATDCEAAFGGDEPAEGGTELPADPPVVVSPGGFGGVGG